MERVLGLYRTLRSERRAFGYVAALGIVAVATAIRIALDGSAPANVRFVTFYPAVLVTAALFGVGPGLVALAASVASIWYYLIGSPRAFEPLSVEEDTALAFFVGANLVNLLVAGLLRSATDQSQRAMERASDAERRLTVALAAGRMGTISFDYRALTGRWSATAAQIFGYEPSERSVTLADWRALITPEDRPRAEAALFRAATADERFYAGTFRIRRPDGTERIVDFSGTARCDAAGAPLEIDGVVVDVTDRAAQHRRIEELAADLARSEERLRIAAESAGIGIWDWNPVEGTRTWSPEFRAILGAPADQPADPAWFGARIHPADRERVVAGHAASMAPGDIDRHDDAFRIIRTTDGAVRHVVVRGSVIRDGRGAVQRAIGTMIDATDIRSAETAIARSRDRVAIATAAAGLGVFEYSQDHPDGVWENERLYEIFGRDPALGPIPRDVLKQDVIIAEDLPVYEAAERQARVGGTFRVQIRVRHPSEGVRRIEIVGRGSIDPDGRRIAVGTVKDITERHAAEERQHVLINELNHRVKNVLATVQAIATSSLRGTECLPDFLDRLGALAVANDILTRENWERADVASVADEVLAPYHRPDGAGVTTEGPPVTLGARGALAVAMTLHELATNAAKYGALSVPSGRVAVAWTLAPADGGQRLTILWRETGGPPVTPPSRRGFGSRLMERMLGQEMGGSIAFDYAPSGLTATIALVVGGPARPADPVRDPSIPTGGGAENPRPGAPTLKLVGSSRPT